MSKPGGSNSGEDGDHNAIQPTSSSSTSTSSACVIASSAAAVASGCDTAVTDWVQGFHDLNKDGAKSAALLHLVSSLDSTEENKVESHHYHRYLHRMLLNIMRRDFLTRLPEDVAYRILSYLSARDLFSCGAVCRVWRHLASNDQLWKRFCGEEITSTAVASSTALASAPAQRIPAAPTPARAAIEAGARDSAIVEGTHGSRRLPSAAFSSSSLSSISTLRSVWVHRQRLRRAWCSDPLPQCTIRRHCHSGLTIRALVAAGPDLVISASDDNTLKVWRISSMTCVRILSGHTSRVWCCDVEYDSDLIASGSCDCTLRLWTLSTGTFLRILVGHRNTVRCVRICGSRVVSGSNDHSVRLWDARTGECLQTYLGHAQAVRCVDFDGATIISGGYDGTVRVWHHAQPDCVHTLRMPSMPGGRIYCVKLHPDGDVAASGNMYGSVSVWDVVNGLPIHHMQELTDSLITDLQFVPHRPLLISSGATGHLRVWDTGTGACRDLYTEHRDSIMDFAISRDGDHVISASADGTIRLWDLEKRRCVRVLFTVPPNIAPAETHDADANSSPLVDQIVISDSHLVCSVGWDESKHLAMLDFATSVLAS